MSLSIVNMTHSQLSDSNTELPRPNLSAFEQPRTPDKSHSKSSRRTPKSTSPICYSGRYIPSRRTSSFDFLDLNSPNSSNQPCNSDMQSPELNKSQYSSILHESFFESKSVAPTLKRSSPYPSKFRKVYSSYSPVSSQSPLSNRTFRFQSSMIKSSPIDEICPFSIFSDSVPHYNHRKISKKPCKILDAHGLLDDFYLNLIDWSSTNILAIGLRSIVYTLHAKTYDVTQVMDVQDMIDSTVTMEKIVSSVAWSSHSELAVGTMVGKIFLVDSEVGKQTQMLLGHSGRIGCLHWNGQLLASGSRDRSILIRDIRTPGHPFVGEIKQHFQEICGLKWNYDGRTLASGGNDNSIRIWDLRKLRQPIYEYTQHSAAVKALCWSPHQNGILLTGGGTADRCLRVFNLHSEPKLIKKIDTGSQICAVLFSPNVNEFVSSHGYSLNQINVWSYRNFTKLETLLGHTTRVLFLALSPDGQTVVSGAGDETLRFWSIFPESRGYSSFTRLSLPSPTIR